MSKWTVFIEYLELNQKLYCLEYDDRRIANITKEQFEDFEWLLSKAPEKPPAGKCKKSRNDLILENMKLQVLLDRSEASREELLTACETVLAIQLWASHITNAPKELYEDIKQVEAAIAKEKEVKK